MTTIEVLPRGAPRRAQLTVAWKRMDQVRELYKEGKTNQEIAAELGLELRKVQQDLSRMNLRANRNYQPRRTSAEHARNALKPAAKPAFVEPPREVPQIREALVPIVAWNGKRGCQWIGTDERHPTDKDKCGKPRIDGSVYCGEHYETTHRVTPAPVRMAFSGRSRRI